MQFIQVTKQEAIRALVIDAKIVLCPNIPCKSYEHSDTILSLNDVLRVAKTNLWGCHALSKAKKRVTEAFTKVLELNYGHCPNDKDLSYYVMVP